MYIWMLILKHAPIEYNPVSKFCCTPIEVEFYCGRLGVAVRFGACFRSPTKTRFDFALVSLGINSMEVLVRQNVLQLRMVSPFW